MDAGLELGAAGLQSSPLSQDSVHIYLCLDRDYFTAGPGGAGHQWGGLPSGEGPVRCGYHSDGLLSSLGTGQS